MSLIENSQYDKNILYDDGYNYQGLKQRVYFQKNIFKQNGKTQYFLKSYVNGEKGLDCQAYIYFYLNKELKTSDFIGIYVKPKYRNNGLASFLVSNWIQLCLNNGYNFLGTNKTQRKPFLLYLLKTYGFEILDKSMYETSNNVIHICKSNYDNTKYLLFKNKFEEENFMRGKIAREDNYKAIPELSSNMAYLDSVILSQIYNVDDESKADKKSTLVIKRHRGR